MNDADREIALHNRIRELEMALSTIAEDVDPGRPLLTMTQVRELPDRVRAVLHERDTARAEADALRAEVAALKADPLRALLTFLDDNDAEIEITRTTGDDDDDPATWMISYTICGSGSWAEGALDAAARKLCDRLGVDHG